MVPGYGTRLRNHTKNQTTVPRYRTPGPDYRTQSDPDYRAQSDPDNRTQSDPDYRTLATASGKSTRQAGLRCCLRVEERREEGEGEMGMAGMGDGLVRSKDGLERR